VESGAWGVGCLYNNNASAGPPTFACNVTFTLAVATGNGQQGHPAPPTKPGPSTQGLALILNFPTNGSQYLVFTLKVAQESACLDAYSDHNQNSFCLAHELKEGTCHGDGGSGAVYGDKLIGLTNFVVGACGSRYPDVFVRLSSFYDWIQEQIA